MTLMKSYRTLPVGRPEISPPIVCIDRTAEDYSEDFSTDERLVPREPATRSDLYCDANPVRIDPARFDPTRFDRSRTSRKDVNRSDLRQKFGFFSPSMNFKTSSADRVSRQPQLVPTKSVALKHIKHRHFGHFHEPSFDKLAGDIFVMLKVTPSDLLQPTNACANIPYNKLMVDVEPLTIKKLGRQSSQPSINLSGRGKPAAAKPESIQKLSANVSLSTINLNQVLPLKPHVLNK